jgi:hypothetical protein
MIHSKEDLKKARKKVAEVKEEIDKLELVTLPVAVKTVDWGQPKAQGKRNGHMVKGSMAAMIKGDTNYYGVDFSKYFIKEFAEDFLLINDNARIFFYATAREYGLNHIESMIYAVGRSKKS